MPVLERPELEASPLADLHTIADQLGLDGFRRLRKADLIDAILKDGSSGGAGREVGDDHDDRPQAAVSRDRDDRDAKDDRAQGGERPRRRRSLRVRRTSSASAAGDEPGRRPAPGRREDAGASDDDAERAADSVGRIAAGVVELLGNGSAFLRVTPPEPSDDDVYISAAQVRRCELVSGDRVTGPVRTPRRSERYPSIVRIDTINGVSADAVSDGSRYEELPVAWPSQRLALGAEDPTLHAIEWLTPLGRGSRAVIVGARHAGKTATLRRLLEVLGGQADLDVSLVLCGARPEELADWQDGGAGLPTPAAALDFAASADSQAQALERAIDTAKRIASRGGDALVAVDCLDGPAPNVARRALAAARNLREGGSLTVIATAAEPLGGETTVIALDATLASTGRQPILDLVASHTLRPELLVGEDGAEAIAKARAAAVEEASG
jgi:transcription termination factor Rho